MSAHVHPIRPVAAFSPLCYDLPHCDRLKKGLPIVTESRIARLDQKLSALRRALETRQERILEEALTIQAIPAPTFDESRRAAYIRQRLGGIAGLDSIHVDDLHNVYARLAGRDRQAAGILVSAHTDTVFDLATPLTARREGRHIYAPGLGDNSLGVAALIATADLLADHLLPCDVWFVANSREEGLGDLGGIRAVTDYLKGRIGTAIVLEGMALGRIYHAGIAVRRLKIHCKGQGGHSWLHFGRESAIHGLLRLGAGIAALRVPEHPRTTYNIGVIEGGSTVNTIAADASLLLDLRSESTEALARLEKAVQMLIDQNRTPDLTYDVTLVGDRPAGAIPRAHPLPQLAGEVLQHLGIRPLYETGSTDANMLLHKGIPTVTLGITQGGNAHRLDEYIEIEGMLSGMWQLVLIIAGAAEYL